MAEVVLISRKSDPERQRWVYLDIGKFNGLAETTDEMIRYPIRTEFDDDALEPCVIAGLTCDSVDVLYEKEPYPLPVSLEIGAKVLIEGTGAYATTYSAVGFNGFPMEFRPTTVERAFQLAKSGRFLSWGKLGYSLVASAMAYRRSRAENFSGSLTN